MMEKGQWNEYRGKSLDEIDIDVDELVSGEEEDSADEENEIIINQATALKTIELNKNKSNSSAKVKSQKHVKLGTKGSKIKKTIVIPWSEGDKGIVTSYFKKYILLGKTPKKHECEEFMLLYPQINKPWKKVKVITKLIH